MKKEQKRFIAGAVCPRCREIDKLFVYRLADKKFRECVSCDFLEEQNFAPFVRELDTRVTDNNPIHNEEQVVHLVEPKKDDQEDR